MDLTLITIIMTFSTDWCTRNIPLIDRSLIPALRTDLAFQVIPAHDIALRAEDLFEVVLSTAEVLRS